MKKRALFSVLLAATVCLSSVQTLAQPVSATAGKVGLSPTSSTVLLRAVSPAVRSQQYVIESTTRAYWDGSGWPPYSETRHVYDLTRRIESINYYQSEHTPVPSHRTTYAANGEIESFDQWDVESGSYIPVERYSYTLAFDAIRQRYATEQSTREVYSGAWENAERWTFTIGAHASGSLYLLGGTNEVADGALWRVSRRFTLDDVGEDVVQTDQSRLGTEWINTEQATYPGQSVSGLYDLLMDRAAQYEDLLDLNLSSLLHPDVTYKVWDGSSWINSHRQFVATRDPASGQPQLLVYQEWDGTRWFDTSRHEVEYERASGTDRPRASTLYGVDGDQPVMPFLTEDYTYDATGLLVMALQRLDSGAGLENHARIVYTWTGLSVGNEGDAAQPMSNRLSSVYPDPFNTRASVTYLLETDGHVTISVFDVLGRPIKQLANGHHNAGTHTEELDGTGMTSGLYVIRLETPTGVQSRTVTLVK
ncbi:MAG: T9SS type A sorting domain-containing protein [Rhodothermales bacterium]|nr:T9SS type A sorting domain-containing protein [Rhodothermales bacterium]